MTKTYDIRTWQPGDEIAILELFEQSYGRELPLQFWNWRFKDHPSGGPLIMLAFDDEKLNVQELVTNQAGKVTFPLESLESKQSPILVVAASAPTTLEPAEYELLIRP